MSRIVRVNPFRCRVWDLHDRLEQLVDEHSCQAEIDSFSRHGQMIPALGRALQNDRNYDVELICGARRLFVARHLNVELQVELRDLTDQAAIIAMDIENRQRRDISPYERGLSFARCLRSSCFRSQEELARALKISQSQVSRLLALAQLPSVVVNAFPSAREIREGWAPDLLSNLQTDERQATIQRARSLVKMSPRPPAIEVYQSLIGAGMASRRPRRKRGDEVVTDVDGSPLFRVRTLGKAVALLLPIQEVSSDTLGAVRTAVKDVMQQARSDLREPKSSATGNNSRVKARVEAAGRLNPAKFLQDSRV